MRRWKVTVGLLVIALGLVAIVMWALGRRYLRATSDFKPSLSEPVTLPAIPSCFPGRSTELSQIQLEGSYFPKGVPPFFNEWFSKHLRAMNEPSLLSPHSFDEAYRFLWLRSFHHPIAVRVWSEGDRHFLAAVELSGAGGYQPGKALTKKSRSVTPEEWITFTRLVEASCLWNLAQEDTDDLGNDGAEWILEGIRKGRYHVAVRWSPEGGDYRGACLYLLKISGLGINEKSKDFY